MGLERDLRGKEETEKDRILEAGKDSGLGVLVSSGKAIEGVKDENWNRL